ncbi:MAG: hypothetical protein EAZ27_08550 [Cytophagales bacterium]|nr:MAG: hypothetical protein EAZ27_08550 [Cytophagales bacterium]
MNEVVEIVMNTWKIECMHTPETIDKIVMNFRKRGMILDSLNYRKLNELKSECIITFEDTVLSSNRIYSNMLRIYDIVSVERL